CSVCPKARSVKECISALADSDRNPQCSFHRAVECDWMTIQNDRTIPGVSWCQSSGCQLRHITKADKHHVDGSALLENRITRRIFLSHFYENIYQRLLNELLEVISYFRQIV